MSWRDDLLPASFRGVPFYVSDHDRTGGRRVVTSEFPFRDAVTTEDLGRTVRKYNLTAYVLGDDYFTDRDALIAACEANDTPGTLVHPYLGELRVRCEGLGTKERQEDGRVAVFTLSFTDAGDPPKVGVDTRAGWLGAIQKVFSIAKTAFRIFNIVRNLSSNVLLGWLGDFAIGRAAAFLGLPGISLSTVRATLNSLTNFATGKPDTIPDVAQPPLTLSLADRDSDAIVTLIQAPHLALADATAATPAPAPSASTASTAIGATAQSSRGEEVDPARLVGIVLLQPIPPRAVDARLTGDEAAAVAALSTLAYGAAVAAAATTMADTAWPNSDVATAARDTLLDAVDVLAEAAADAGQNELYAAWRAFAAAAAVDLTARAMQAPRVQPYVVPRATSALVLAHRLYQDATRADELTALNAAPHPAFLPAAGVMVAA